MSSVEKKETEPDSDEEEILPKQATLAPEPEEEEDTSLANSDVVTKYHEAAKIVNAALLELAKQVLPILLIGFSC
jgi:hypothetical protein